MFSFAASVLEFDDNKKQKTYEAISFREVHDEILELKVFALFIHILAVIFVFFFHCTAGSNKILLSFVSPMLITRYESF